MKRANKQATLRNAVNVANIYIYNACDGACIVHAYEKI